METISKWARKVGSFVDGLVLPENLPRQQVVVDVESITEQKREWIEQQQSTTTKDLATWPDHLFESFVIVGLPPDMEITQIAEDLCEKEHRREAAEASRCDETPAGSCPEPPWPAYEPAVLFKYPHGPGQGHGPGMELSDREISCLCFPSKVPPRKLKRSPSWSALNKVVYQRQAFNQDGNSFIFMLKVGLGLPLYGVCCYVEEVLHRPPLMAKDNFPSCRGPFRQCLIAAPRCYCLLSRYPFFPLHFSVLREILDLERLSRVVQLNAEMGEAVLDASPVGSRHPASFRQPPAPAPPAKAVAAEERRSPAAAAGPSEAKAPPAGAPEPTAEALSERLSAHTSRSTLRQQQQNEALFQRISETYSNNSKHVEQSFKRRSHYKPSGSTGLAPAPPRPAPAVSHNLSDSALQELPACSDAGGGLRHLAQKAVGLDRVSEATSLPMSPTAEEVGREGSARTSPDRGGELLPSSSSAPSPVTIDVSSLLDADSPCDRACDSAARDRGLSQCVQQQGPGDESGTAAATAEDRSPEKHDDLDASFERMSAAGTRSFHFHPEKILDQILAADIPTPGDPLVIELTGMSSFPRTTTLVFTRPQLPGRFTVLGPQRQLLGYAEAELTQCLQSWTVAVAARLLSLDNLLLMLTAALLEEQIVVFCPNIAASSSVVLSLVPLLRPFSLQGLLLPVTPSSLMSFIDAPVPFVLGLQHNTPDIQSRCTDLVQVLLDQDQVINVEGLPHLPGLKRLKAALQPHYQTLHQAQGAASKAKFPGLSSEEELASSKLTEVLQGHLQHLVGDIRPHVITNVNLGKRTSVLMKASLTESFPRSNRSFISAFLETQLFSVWCDQVISTQIEMAAQ